MVFIKKPDKPEVIHKSGPDEKQVQICGLVQKSKAQRTTIIQADIKLGKAVVVAPAGLALIGKHYLVAELQRHILDWKRGQTFNAGAIYVS